MSDFIKLTSREFDWLTSAAIKPIEITSEEDFPDTHSELYKRIHTYLTPHVSIIIDSTVTVSSYTVEVYYKTFCTEPAELFIIDGGYTNLPSVLHDMFDISFDFDAEANALRYNDNKLDLTLLPVKALEEEAKVWGFGEKKYGRDNWKKLWGKDTVNVVMASLMRHSLAILSGEVNDLESGLPHAAHIRCNAAMLIEHQKSSDNWTISSPYRLPLEY